MARQERKPRKPRQRRRTHATRKPVERDWLSRISHHIAMKHAGRELHPQLVWVRPTEAEGYRWYNVCYRLSKDGSVNVLDNPLDVSSKDWAAYCRYQEQFKPGFRKRVERYSKRDLESSV